MEKTYDDKLTALRDLLYWRSVECLVNDYEKVRNNPDEVAEKFAGSDFHQGVQLFLLADLALTLRKIRD
jgi:hypothetical protein